jgi:hypothetical protein
MIRGIPLDDLMIGSYREVLFPSKIQIEKVDRRREGKNILELYITHRLIKTGAEPPTGDFISEEACGLRMS